MEPIAAGKAIDELVAAGAIHSAQYDSLDRYSRHLLYFDLIGLEPSEAQARLRQAHVALLGVGGIGSNIAILLAAAGVDCLTLIDADQIELSNLTRQFFSEVQIGTLKVEAARANVVSVNSEVVIRTVSQAVDGVDFLEEHCGNADLVVLSADAPPDIHEWLNEASLRCGFAYSTAGYIEAYGSVGPLIDPGRTACLECFRLQGDLYREGPEDSVTRNYNLGFQAASFGPLNSLVSAVQANEVIRHLIGADATSAGRRILVNSQTYEVHTEEFLRNPTCPACSNLKAAPNSPPPPMARGRGSGVA